ncbi:MAG: hypothetical protein GY827_05205, partial [Cytophagales bacterium]|nr:hypothetical protein [Cytophagales bacterium]
MKTQIIILMMIYHYIKTQIPDHDKEHATNIEVTHYDCTNPGNPTVYSLTNVDECKMVDEDIDHAVAKVSFHQLNPLFEIEAIKCTIKYSKNVWHCGMYSHSQISRVNAEITRDMKLTHEKCKEAYTSHFYVDTTLSENTIKIRMVNDSRELQVNTQGKESKDGSWYDCKGYGAVYKFSFDAYITTVKLTMNKKTGKVLNNHGQPLTCKFDSGGCDSLMGDMAAYSWDVKDQCVMYQLPEI